jgi:ATP-dependent RNA helicase DHX57
VLRLQEESQKLVMATLRQLYGDGYQLKDKSGYKDKGSRLKKKYWQERGNLVVQGGCDYSNIVKTGSSTEDKFRLFAIMKLESYGFHKRHCLEALESFNGDVAASLELLFGKYFPAPAEKARRTSNTNYSESELLEMRLDEKAALESIYDKVFAEKEKNIVWQFKFRDIDYLLQFSPTEKRRRLEAEAEERRKATEKPSKKKKEVEQCRQFVKTGRCKFANRCRYSHKAPDPENHDQPGTEKKQEEDDNNCFYLEFRFPKTSAYPFECPIVLLKTTCPDIPHSVTLRVNRRLAQEARTLTNDGMPCVYSVAELLQMEEEILEFLNTDRSPFPDGKRSLFYEPDEEEVEESKPKNRPTHYTKGSTGKESSGQYRPDVLLKEDLNIVRKFMDKQTNQQYLKMLASRRNLPAWNMMGDILKAVEGSQVVVISGETGCGKSTQVPQFLLDEWLLSASQTSNKSKVGHVEIVCTQPRRISAIGVAERVADERNERVGNTVGYQIRLENKISASTRLTFCTTGILLRRLCSDPLLQSVSHILVDEVHERSEESDFLLLILKRLLKRRKELKVILMSATLNANLFSDYFGGAPVLEIPGRTFPVEQLFLEDVLEASGFVLEADSQYCRRLNKKEQDALMQELEYADLQAAGTPPARSIRDENLSLTDVFSRYADYSKRTCKSLFLLDPMKINPELIEHVLRHIVEGEHKWPKEGTILVFLPGLAEIQAVHDALCDSSLFSPRAGKFVLVPLHSTLTSEEQSQVFRKAPVGKRKIVLSTNIAETSVTIDDCVFVVDCGMMKEKRFDSNRNMESLDVVWVSRANAQQRKGRAGRVMPGISIHLFTG